MEQKPEDLRQALIFQPSLLSFESQRDYRQLANAIRDHISPQDILEEMWTSEIIEGEWEIVRLRRHKSQIVSLAKPIALRNLLNTIWDAADDQIDDVARRWFTNKDVRKRVEALLLSNDLEESVIDVEAYRVSMGDLVEIDRRLSELVVRRDKIFRQIEDYRAGMSTPPSRGPRQHGDQQLRIEDAGDA
jgi:hypothetical protein